jgi:hypothetical protein
MVSSPVGNLVITTATTTTMPEDQQQDNASLFSANSEEESFSIRKHLHWWNTLAFVFNFVVTYGVGTMGWIGKGTNEELSEKYQVRGLEDFLEYLFGSCSHNDPPV